MSTQTDCIETDWRRDEWGYGRRIVGSHADGTQRTLRAHREVMREHHVPIAGMIVRHCCDNPSCVNVDHLTVGTHADNMRDMNERGRNGLAKLTPYAVRWIRSHVQSGRAQRDMVEMFGISEANVSMIVNRKTWRHV